MLTSAVLQSFVPVLLDPIRTDRHATGCGGDRRPPLWWRIRQRARLLLPGPFPVPRAYSATGLLAFLGAVLAWPLTSQSLLPWIARLARSLGLLVAYSEMRGRVRHADGTWTDYGLLSRRVVTTAGANFLASAFDNTVEPEVMKYHGFGTGNTAEAVGDTALVTELTTEYATDNTRPTGSQSHSSNTYTTVATLSPDATVTIQEHGIFSQAATGGGTLWDRSVFTGIALTGSSDSLQSTYVLTLPSGG